MNQHGRRGEDSERGQGYVFPNGKVLKLAREDVLGWTQEKLKNVSGVAIRTIQRVESSGSTKFPVRVHRSTLSNIVEALEKGHQAGRIAMPDRSAFEMSGDTPRFEENQRRVADMDFALRKAALDFDNSCIRKIELLNIAVDTSEAQMSKLIEKANKDPIAVFGARLLRSPRQIADSDIQARIRRVKEHASNNPIRVSNECIEVGPLATWLSMAARHEIALNIAYEDASGREQMLGVDRGNGPFDFVVTAQAPFVMSGHNKSLEYLDAGPIHREPQYLLEKIGKYTWPVRYVLVYENSSAHEQLLVQDEKRMMDTSPLYVPSLEELVERCDDLRNGDMIIAWEPLASGLKARIRSLQAVGSPYRHCVNLSYHKRWNREALVQIRDDVATVFSSEWNHCDTNRDWAETCLRKDNANIGYRVKEFLSRVSVGGGLSL